MCAGRVIPLVLEGKVETLRCLLVMQRTGASQIANYFS